MLFYFYSKKDNHLPGLMVVIFNFNIPIIVCRFLFPKQSLRRYRVCHPSFINFSRSKWIYTFPIPYLNIITVCRYFSFIPNISPDICIFIYCVSFFQSYRTDWSFFPSDFFILFLWDTAWGVIFFPWVEMNPMPPREISFISFFVALLVWGLSRIILMMALFILQPEKRENLSANRAIASELNNS